MRPDEESVKLTKQKHRSTVTWEEALAVLVALGLDLLGEPPARGTGRLVWQIDPTPGTSRTQETPTCSCCMGWLC